jgi:hypothetical protein
MITGIKKKINERTKFCDLRATMDSSKVKKSNKTNTAQAPDQKDSVEKELSKNKVKVLKNSASQNKKNDNNISSAEQTR